jgi:hypothetical protein
LFVSINPVVCNKIPQKSFLRKINIAYHITTTVKPKEVKTGCQSTIPSPTARFTVILPISSDVLGTI